MKPTEVTYTTYIVLDNGQETKVQVTGLVKYIKFIDYIRLHNSEVEIISVFNLDDRAPINVDSLKGTKWITILEEGLIRTFKREFMDAFGIVDYNSEYDQVVD